MTIFFLTILFLIKEVQWNRKKNVKDCYSSKKIGETVNVQEEVTNFCHKNSFKNLTDFRSKLPNTFAYFGHARFNMRN